MVPYSQVPILYQPYGGINSEESEVEIDPSQCADAYNLLFGKRRVINRPGKSTSVTNMSGPLSIGEFTSVLSMGTGWDLAVTGGNVIWRSMAIGASPWASLTGPALTGFSYFMAEAVNGVVLMPGLNGIVNWNPSGTTYTLISSVKPRFITSHLGRALGAGDGTTQAGPNSNVFYGSVVNDVTTWAGAVNGSFAIVLSDIDDVITGLQILQNVPIIIRSNGISLAVPTGIGLAPYAIKTWSKHGVGCPYESTVARGETFDQAGNATSCIFFVGQDDVYTFDLSMMRGIGGNVRSQLMTAMNVQTYVGFTTRLQFSGSSYTYLYHLAPLGISPSATYPHFAYDARYGTWSKHTYGNTFMGVAASISQPAFGGPGGIFAFIDDSNPPRYSVWADSVPCEQVATLTGRTFMVGAPAADVLLERALITNRDYNGQVALSVNLKQGKTTVTASVGNTSIGANNDGKYVRTFLDVGRQTGNLIQPVLTIPANTKFALHSLMLQINDSPEAFRG